ncbi:MAG: DUF2059 domain-containing protein [Roseovarius sp.]|nr:DUF2059 domain-containing protein [Roseovarius sp.]
MSVPSSVLRLAAIVLAWGLVLGSVAAQATGRDRIAAFLEVTGFGVALDSIVLSARDAPAMVGLAPSDFGPAWERIVAELFDKGAMRESAMDILAEALDEEMLDHATEFYASDLGRRLVAVENAAHMRADDSHGAGEALLARMDPGRRAALEAMNDAIDASGQSLLAAQEIRFRFLMAAAASGLTEEVPDADMLRRMLAREAEAMRADMRAAALANAAQTYRDIPTADLRAYAEALGHPVMARVYELMNAVQYEIMAERLEALALRLGKVPRAQEL